MYLALSISQHIWEYFLVTGAPSPTYLFSLLIHNLNLMDCFLWALLNLFPYTCIFYKLALSVILNPISNSNVRLLIPLFSSQEIFVPRNVSIIMYLSYTYFQILISNCTVLFFFLFGFLFVCFGCLSACLVLVPWIEPGLWQWKPWVLTIRLPRNSPTVTVNNKTSQCKVWFFCISFCP